MSSGFLYCIIQARLHGMHSVAWCTTSSITAERKCVGQPNLTCRHVGMAPVLQGFSIRFSASWKRF